MNETRKLVKPEKKKQVEPSRNFRDKKNLKQMRGNARSSEAAVGTRSSVGRPAKRHGVRVSPISDATGVK